MQSMMRIGVQTSSDSLPAYESQTQRPVIWYEEEDLDETDEPFIVHLLEDSFEQWLSENEQAEQADCHCILFDVHGRIIARCDDSIPQIEIEAYADTVAEACLQGSCRVAEDIIIVPIRRRSNAGNFAALAWIGIPRGRWMEQWLHSAALHFRMIFYHRFEQVFVRDMIIQQQLEEKESKRRDILFQAAKRLHDQHSVSSVIHELLQNLETCYPYSEIDLYLSQDFVKDDERIKPLIIRNAANNLYAKAFIDSKPTLERDEDGTVRLGIPMGGKQAVYGVLGIAMSGDRWDESELRAFIMLADTAGSAFENARLYEQSNLLVGELQLINELTKRLNQSLRLNEIFQFAMNELLHIFNADYCSILQLQTNERLLRVMASNLPAITNEIFSVEHGYSGVVFKTKEPVIVSDYWSNRLAASKLMDSTGSRSLIATPILVGSEVVGVIKITHKNPHFFSYNNYKLLQVLSTHIGLAISNASLHAEVRRMVITDNLTGLHARHYLNEQIQSRQRKDPCGSLILVDIDHFKKVNDTFGHQVGDRILIAVSEVIRSCIRETDIAARWGGEELAVYLPQIRLEQAYRIAERIRARVEERTEPAVTVSCGLSEWTFENEKISVESLFYRADMALYEAKKSGRNQIFAGN
ncbi:diguanylate cyclase domain-containing protein [Paenibacillus sp. GCM10027626]|uniref:diguanylate cyclase domain-containing protein n=1 Tax=Paenibacillus sp. GCM10027626 TaxID=3273411 RepID=UPI0036358EDF